MNISESLITLNVMKDSLTQERIMSSLKREDLLTYCICDFMLLTGSDLKSTLLLTFEQLYTSYQHRLVPVSNLYAGSRLVYLDKDCGLFSILDEELSGYVMQSYSGILTDYVFSTRGSNNKAINRSSMARKIGQFLEKNGYQASASLFKNTFGYLYFCKYHTLIGTPFSYMCYRKDQIKNVFSLSDSEYNAIMDTSFNLDEAYQIADITNKIRNAYACIRNNSSYSTAALDFLSELSILIESYDA